MQIKIDEAILGVKQWECEVVSNNNVATFIKEFVVKSSEGENLNLFLEVIFKLIYPNTRLSFDFDIQDRFRGDWDNLMWNLTCTNTEETVRAYSMANYPVEGNIVMLNIRITTTF